MSTLSRIRLVAWREAVALGRAPTTWFFLAVFLALGGVIFVNHLAASRYASLDGFYVRLATLLMFFVPALACRSFTGDRVGGLLPLYAVSPLTERELVWGRFFGLGVWIFAAVILTFEYPLILMAYSDPDPGPFCGATLGLGLFSAVLLSQTLFVSTLTANFSLAAVMSVGLSLVFWWAIPIGKMAGPLLGAEIASLSILAPFVNFCHGVVSTGDVTFLLGLALLFLSAACRGVEARRW